MYQGNTNHQDTFFCCEKIFWVQNSNKSGHSLVLTELGFPFVVREALKTKQSAILKVTCCHYWLSLSMFFGYFGLFWKVWFLKCTVELVLNWIVKTITCIQSIPINILFNVHFSGDNALDVAKWWADPRVLEIVKAKFETIPQPKEGKKGKGKKGRGKSGQKKAPARAQSVPPIPQGGMTTQQVRILHKFFKQSWFTKNENKYMYIVIFVICYNRGMAWVTSS